MSTNKFANYTESKQTIFGWSQYATFHTHNRERARKSERQNFFFFCFHAHTFQPNDFDFVGNFITENCLDARNKIWFNLPHSITVVAHNLGSESLHRMPVKLCTIVLEETFFSVFRLTLLSNQCTKNCIFT